MITAFVIGALAGGGVWLLAGAIRPARRGLGEAMAALWRPADPIVSTGGGGRRGLVARVGRLVAKVIAPSVDLRADLEVVTTAEPDRTGSGGSTNLAVTGTTLEEHAGKKLLCALAGLVGLPALLWVLSSLTGAAVPWKLPLFVSIGLGAGGFYLPDLMVRQRAAERRVEFRQAFEGFMDVVALLLAGGEGPEGALAKAASAGHTWPFRELRRAMNEGHLRNQSTWESLDRLGASFGVKELQELAGAARLASGQGAAQVASITHKAASMRDHALADEEAAAERASVRMTLPLAIMAVGFLLYIGYPAMRLVMETGP